MKKFKYFTILPFFVFFVLLAPLQTSANTQIKIFMPLSPNVPTETLGLHEITEGECQSSLMSTARNDAYRCINKAGKILDPCFSQFGKKNLLCVQNPWENDSLIFTPTKKAIDTEKRTPLLDSLPWAIKLKNRKTCFLNTGASAILAGMRVQYQCDHNSYLLGEIHKTNDQWSIFYHQEDERFAKMIKIDQAIF